MSSALFPAALALASLSSLGCHIVIGVGDHEASDATGTAATQASSSTGSGGGSDGGNGGGGAMPECDLPPPMLVASGQNRPGAIVANATHVFWIDEAFGGQPGRLMGATRDGTDVAPLVSGLSNPVSLKRFVQGTNLYFTNDVGGVPAERSTVGVFKVPEKGGEPILISDVDGLGAGTLSVNNTFAYSEAWSPTAPVRARKTSVNPSPGDPDCYPMTSGPAGSRITAMVATDALYAATTGSDSILRVDYDCGSIATVFAGGQPDVRWMLFDSQYIFWITADSVFRQAKGEGTEKALLLERGFEDLVSLTGVSNGVVVTSRAAGTVTKVNTISKTLLACGQSEPHGIADFGGSIFWTNRGSGEVVRLDLPQ